MCIIVWQWLFGFRCIAPLYSNDLVSHANSSVLGRRGDTGLRSDQRAVSAGGFVALLHKTLPADPHGVDHNARASMNVIPQHSGGFVFCNRVSSPPVPRHRRTQRRSDEGRRGGAGGISANACVMSCNQGTADLYTPVGAPGCGHCRYAR